MKQGKFNKNIILFSACFAFVIIGLCSSNLMQKLGDSLIGLSKGKASIEETIDEVNSIFSKEITYHDQMIDLFGLKERILGSRVINKSFVMYVKSDSDSLIYEVPKLNEDEIRKTAEKISELQKVSEENGAKFLYCVTPEKELYEKSPDNVDNYFQENYNCFISKLDDANVPYIDLAKSLNESDIPASDLFFYTDHHWKPISGFTASAAISRELNLRYGFNYDNQCSDIKNFNIKEYPGLFLGSRGKNVGRLFSNHGTDDFDVITPKFKTDITEEQPFKNLIREGSFENTTLYMNFLEEDPYSINTYCTYCGGNYRLQIFRNNLKPEGKKVLLICDSFANVVSPFFALQTGELHICDMRDFEDFVGEKINVEEYIKKEKPDYVLVLYSGVSSLEESNGAFDFF